MAIVMHFLAWIACIIVVGFCAYIVAEAIYYQWLLGHELEHDLGFRDGSHYYRVEGRLCSAVALDAIVDTGILARAGCNTGDVIPGFSHSGLFKFLHRHCGRETEMRIVVGGDGLPLDQRPFRVVRFVVPARRTLKWVPWD